MIIRRIHDDALSQTTYLVACEQSREAILIDPARDIDRALAVAGREEVRVIAAVETHVHADFVSGVPALAAIDGIDAWVSGVCGEPEWLAHATETQRSSVRLLRDGDTRALGSLTLRILHTPGHTPEAISLAVIGSDGQVRALFSGDFLFAGHVGRPDVGTAQAHDPAARRAAAAQIQAALAKLGELGDDVLVYPTHTAGSPCGKTVAALPVTKMGIERRINAPMRSCESTPEEFAAHALADAPDQPAYFRRVKQLNTSAGCCGVGDCPPHALALDRQAFLAALASPSSVVVDCRAWPRFNDGFVVGAISAPLDRFFAMSAGSYLEQSDDVLLVCSQHEVERAVRALWRIGVESFRGWIDAASYDAIPDRLLPLEEIEEVSATSAYARWRAGGVRLVDVRGCTEYAAGHLPGAAFAPFTQLPDRCGEWDTATPIMCYCRSGNRSARACAYLRRKGFTVTNMRGGYWPWAGRGFPVERGTPAGIVRC